MDKIVTSKSKFVRVTQRKARLVVDSIRGMKALDALVMLDFTNKDAALHVKKCLKSAIANAQNNHDMDKTRLLIVEARVDEAPTFKRGIAVSRGRYHQILKRNCHIIISLSYSVGAIEKKATKKEKVSKNTTKVVKSEPEIKEVEPKKTVKKTSVKKKETTKKSTSSKKITK